MKSTITTLSKLTTNPKRLALMAGILGVVVLLTGSIASYIHTSLVDYNDPAATQDNILVSEFRYRIGIICGLTMQTVFIFYALALFKILRPVHNGLAILMMVLAIVPVPIFMFGQLFKFEALLFALDQSPTQLMHALELHKFSGLLVAIFYGLWLFPLGMLVYRSRFLPKLLGLLLMIGCFGYLLLFVQGMLFPGAEGKLWTNPALIVTHIAEMLLMLWLLIKGVKTEIWEEWLELPAGN